MRNIFTFIFGQGMSGRIHKLVIKGYNFTSKSNNIFIGLGIIGLIYGSIFSMGMSIFIIYLKDTIARMALGSLTIENVSNNVNLAGLFIELDLSKVMIILYINCILHIIMFIILILLILLFISKNIMNKIKLDNIFVIKLVIRLNSKYNNLLINIGTVLLYLISVITLLISIFLANHIFIISGIILGKL